VEQEIDLSPYFRALQRNWPLVVAFALLFGALAYVLTLLAGDNYQATALVAVTESRQLVEFDPRFEDVAPRAQLIRALPEVARSDEIMQSLLASLPAGAVEDQLDLTRMLKAEAGEDANLIRLTVTSFDAELAELIANNWAELFIERVNRLYGTQSTELLAFYEAQKSAAAVVVETAEQALVDFQARNRFLLLNGQLVSLQERQKAHLNSQSNILITQDNIDAMLALLRQSTDATVTYTDQLTLLSIQLKAFSLEGYIPFLLTNEVGGPLTVQDRQRQITALEQLNQTLAGLNAETVQALATLEPQLLEVQRQREEADRESRRLTRERDVAVETYTSLARRVDEERVTSQDTSIGVTLVSAAGRPFHPAPSGAVRNTALGLMLGALIGAAVAVAVSFRRRASNV